MSKIRTNAPESEIRFGLAGPVEKAMLLTSEPPDVPKVREAIEALEAAYRRYCEAGASLRAVDEAEEAHHRAIRREAEAAAVTGRDAEEIEAPLDFDAARRERRAAVEALGVHVRAARAALDKEIAAAVGTQGAKDAQRLPALYEEASQAVQAAQAALERLTTARRVAVRRLLDSDPHATSRPLMGAQIDAAKHLDGALTWLGDRKTSLTDPVVFGEMVPSHREREAMAADPRYIEQLAAIELSEGYARTDYSRAYRHPSEVGPSGLSRGGAEVTAEDISAGDAGGADIAGLAKYI